MRLSLYILVGAILVPGCNNKEDEIPPMPTASPVVSSQPVVLLAEESDAGAEVVRPELDNRDDGVTGTLMTATGAKATMQAPADWKVEKADVQTATAQDQKSRLAVASYGPEGHSLLLDKLAAANGISGCQWGLPQTLTVGKDKLATQAADGSCNRGTAKVSGAYMAVDGLVVVGSWDEGADRSALFGALRSVAKVKTGTGAPSNLVACCRMLAQNAASAPLPQSGFMLQAAATCESAARGNNAAAVNAVLSRFGMKCR